jgi:hypothetical protein
MTVCASKAPDAVRASKACGSAAQQAPYAIVGFLSAAGEREINRLVIL